MRWLLVVAAIWLPSCSCQNKHGDTGDVDANPLDVCAPACAADQVCRYMACVPPPTACTTNTDCPGDAYCDLTRGPGECLPFGVGPGGPMDPACKREPVPGVFFPEAQCEWLGPPAGDAFPAHVNVLATPMVATLYQTGEISAPSIVFTSYNFTDGGLQSCAGTDPLYFGVIRIVDGRTCTQQATISSPTVVASASVAIADIGGDDQTPEIVAARTDGGLVAFTRRGASWEVLWQTTSVFADMLCDWAGPSIHDLDDDGVPEIVFYGNVYDHNGVALDESLGASISASGTGVLPIVADIDGDGAAELITGAEIYTWNKVAKKWAPFKTIGGPNGHVAIADFGTYPATGPAGDDRAHLDGIPEIVVINAGVAHVYTVDGRVVFTAPLLATGGNPVGNGGPPTIADFDGDGRVEFASAGASGYNVFDPDCIGTPDPVTCPSLRTDGVLWVQTSQDFSSNVTGSSVFDFDGDGRAEVVYGDECFTRVYDGKTGAVLYSRYRTSCTWYENPVIADVDADFNAEIVSTSNTNCNVICPAEDPIFDGSNCLADSDCPPATHCGREQPGDALGRCRCTLDADCGGDGFVCRDPLGGASAAGKVCRASHPAGAAAMGIRVLADSVDRWVNTRAIWNQHAYAVTNINDDGSVPRTSQSARPWKTPGLNNFRQNSPGSGLPGAAPDLTVKQVKISCDPGGPTVTAEVCNRGTEPVADGVPVAVYDAASPPAVRCTAATTERLYPGSCASVSCTWTGASGPGSVVVDDRGNGTGVDLECREDNNALAITVTCP